MTSLQHPSKLLSTPNVVIFSLSSADYSNYTSSEDYTDTSYDISMDPEPANKILCGCPFTAQRRIFHIKFFVFSFIIPISVLIFCYMSVYCEVVTVQRGLSEIGNESGAGKLNIRSDLIVVVSYGSTKNRTKFPCGS